MDSSAVDIRAAEEMDLSALYDLARQAMPYDTFSEALLAQKLFFNPQPGLDHYTAFVAEVGGAIVGFLQSVVRRSQGQAWLGLFAVDERYRRRGIARRLFDRARRMWAEQQVQAADVMTIPCNYLVCGLDPRYTPALCFVESVGFACTGCRANMLAHLTGDYRTADAERDLAARGIEVRRACPGDRPGLERFFASNFGAGWLAESQLAMTQDPPALHIAMKEGGIIGFSAHSTMNQEWGNFGPMGSAASARGLGIGRVLLYRCMKDLQDAGFRTSVIPWIGPHGFYARLLDCAIERVFWQYRLDMSERRECDSRGA